MRTILVSAVSALLATGALAQPGGPVLLKPGESPPKGWSVLVFKTDSSFAGGRIKVGASDTCYNEEKRPCHFAAPDGPAEILVDQALEYGDTTATLVVSGERIYFLKTGQHHGRAAARAIGGILGAMLSQPDDPKPGEKAVAPVDSPLLKLRKGSRFDMEFLSAGDTGSAQAFVAPKEDRY